MNKIINDDELRYLASQCRCPQGIDGIKMGYTMNMTNLTPVLNTIHSLNIQPNDSILELGHGNAGHLAYILSLADSIHYTGLEVSETMCSEALKLNAAYCAAGLSEFSLYDGKSILFNPATFDKVLSVNTIYFWEDPVSLISSLAQTMKKDGLLAITFCDKTFMMQLPFVQYGFNLIETSDMDSLFATQPFKLYKHSEKQDKAISKTGQLVTRIYHTFVYQRL